jgi:large subunit ribosomal protein L25
MDHPVINALVRTTSTKGELRQLRVSGKIPAVVYGGGEAAKHIFLDEKEFAKAVHGITESTILSLMIGDTKTEAFVKEHQRDAISGKIIHVDFLEVVKGRILHAKVPIKLMGIPIGVREGGILENPAHEVEVQCDPTYLPEKIEMDVSELHANHSIHVRDIPAIPNVKILTNADLVVAVVKFAKAEVVEAPAAEEVPAGEAAAAAPGTAAPGAAAPGTAAPGAPAAGTAAPAPGAQAAPGASKKSEKK